MSRPDRPTPHTIARTARELVGTPLRPERPGPVAAVLAGLIAEMGPMRAMDVGATEPATLDDLGEPKEPEA